MIPCFNEAHTIGSLVTEVRGYLPSVWVVDDGSSDSTARIAEEAGARTLRHPANLGKGAALATSFRAILEEGYSWALTLDGDGQHAPADIPGLLRCAEQTGAALIIGNRMSQAAAMPWLRRIVNRWMSRRISDRIGLPCPDSQSGFRLVRLASWKQLVLQTRHFEVESEMLLAFAQAGWPPAFAPVRVLAARRPSRIDPLADTWRWLHWWHRSRQRAPVQTVGGGSCLLASPVYPKSS